MLSEIPAAAMISEVYLNGEKLYRHEGKLFFVRSETDRKTAKEKNVVAISVDNQDNTICYPQKADFTFTERSLSWNQRDDCSRKHFAMDYCGTPGLKVTPEVDLDTKTAQVTMEVWTEEIPKKVTISVIGQEEKRSKLQKTMQKQF